MTRNVLSSSLLFCIHLLFQAVSSASNEKVKQVTVLEPFNILNDEWRTSLHNGAGKLDLLVDEDSTRIDYEVVSTELWGGFVELNRIAATEPWNCEGATHVSFFYKTLVAQTLPERVHLRLVLFDDSDCTENCQDFQDLENYYSFHYVLDNVSEDWHEIRVELSGSGDDQSPFWRTGWLGAVGNDVLDLAHVRGWKLEFSMDSQGGANSMSAGAVEIRNLECVDVSKETEEATYVTDVTLLEPFVNLNDEWNILLHNGVGKLELQEGEEDATRIDYEVVSTELWGGFVEVDRIAATEPWNCDGATHVSFFYKTLTAQSLPERVHMRLVLFDDSDCTENCQDMLGLENYYSFHYVLDDVSEDWQEIRVELSGSGNDQSPFWRTGWSGIVGNDMLDLAHVRGWKLEFSMDSQGGANSTSAGALAVSNLACIAVNKAIEEPTYVTEVTLIEPFDDLNDEWKILLHNGVGKLELQEEEENSTRIDYEVVSTELWGGFVEVDLIAESEPWDCEGATHASFFYKTLIAQSNPERVHLRLVLFDDSDCTANCRDGQGLENYYSFHYVLDDVSEDWQEIRVELSGSGNDQSPFWRTGWSGIVGNDMLDLAHVRGWKLEFSMDSQGGDNSTSAGAVAVKRLTCIAVHEGRDEVAYVMEPFQNQAALSDWFTHYHNDAGELSLTVVDDSLFGNGALKVDYSVVSTEPWGGFVDFGNILGNASHNCFGASHLSLVYKTLESQSLPERVHLRLLLLDDSDCTENCTSVFQLENYYSFHYVLDQVSQDWQEIRVELSGSGDENSPLWRTGWLGKVGNDRLDLDHIRGWRIELSIDSQAGVNGTSSGSILIDQLACVGGGDLLGGPLWTPSDNSVEGLSIANGVLAMDYNVEPQSVEPVVSSYQRLAPGAFFYNLTAATGISFSYSFEVSTSPVSLDVRFSLLGCRTMECSDQDPQVDIVSVLLPLMNGTRGTGYGDFSVPIQDVVRMTNTTPSVSHVKGFRFELVVGESFLQELESPESGVVRFNDLAAVLPRKTQDKEEEQLQCTSEPGLSFQYQYSNFQRIEFLSSKCCEACEAHDGCLYAFSNGKDCYIADSLEFDAVGLLNTDFGQKHHRAYVTRNSARRGDYCDRCSCNETNKSIDCRGRNLTIAPINFSPTSWTPSTLDLRDNHGLFIIESGAFDFIGDDLEEIWLPRNLRHLSMESIQELKSLTTIRFEVEEEETQTSSPNQTQGLETNLNNAIASPNGSFGDVCCSAGTHLNLSLPVAGLTFCDIQPHVPGDDSVFIPFDLYVNAKPIQRLQPRSPFMGEAAVSKEKCAEFCSINEKCAYFSYDGRWKESEPSCYLLENNGTHSVTECCTIDDYGDPDRQSPGWTSGFPPRTRHELENAKVIISPKRHIICEDNMFTTTYDVYLGSSPYYGAVWIEPKLSGPSSKFNVTITPKLVVLYDKTMTATVKVTVTNPGSFSIGETLVVSNIIQSCDAAFTAASTEQLAILSTVYVDVVPKEDTNNISTALKAVGIGMVAVQGIFSACFAGWTIYHRNHGVVKRSQPVFLIFVVFGCLLMALSIIPTAIDGGYRYEQDPVTGEETDVLNDDVKRLDAACMAFPWLYNLGFIITYSALFAKIVRVRRILKHASNLRRATVQPKDVAIIMVAFTSVQVLLMLVWQLVDPLRWKREVLETSNQGFPLESVGYCSSDKALAFVIPISVYNFGCLVYALYLCYVTRNVSSELYESKWITLSIITILQILLLAVPVLIIAWEDTNAFFFLRASVIFLTSMGVTCFIFLPKFFLLRSGGGVDASFAARRISLRNSMRSSTLLVPQGIQQETPSSFRTFHTGSTSKRSEGDSDGKGSSDRELVTGVSREGNVCEHEVSVFSSRVEMPSGPTLDSKLEHGIVESDHMEPVDTLDVKLEHGIVESDHMEPVDTLDAKLEHGIVESDHMEPVGILDHDILELDHDILESDHMEPVDTPEDTHGLSAQDRDDPNISISGTHGRDSEPSS